MDVKYFIRYALLSSTIILTNSTLAHAQVAPSQVDGDASGAVVTRPQSDAAAPERSAMDIVVTAQRREQRLQDVPLSLSVTTGETLAKSGTVNLIDLSQRTPGLKMNIGPQSNTIIVRGVGSGLNAGFEQAVGTFLDGVYRPRSRTIPAALFDVERVEVLNGPQTTFFGNNTVAGAINITSRKPSQEFGYNAQALYAPTDGQYIAEGAITGPLSDTLSARAALQVSGMNGYAYNEFLDKDGPRLRDLVGRVSLRWHPSSSFQSDLRVDYARNRDTNSYINEITGCPPPSGFPAARGPCATYLAENGGVVDDVLNFRFANGLSGYRLDMWEGGWTNRVDLGPVAINSISSYNHSKAAYFFNASSLPVAGVAGYLHQPFRQQETYKLFTQELRLESTGDGWISYIAGLYYSHGKLVSNSLSSLYNTTVPGAAGAPVTGPNTPIETNRNLYQTDQTRSVFGQVTARLSPQFRVNAGLRYTSVKKDAHRTGIVGIGGPVASFNDFTPLDAATQALLYPRTGINNIDFDDPHTTYDKLMPSVSLQYDVMPQVTAYASYTKGFKAGGYSDSNTPNQFASESVNAYEVGIKGSALDRRVFFTLDYFYGDYSNLQQSLTTIGPTGVSITRVGNAASSRSQGIEFTGSMSASDYVSFHASGSYIDSKFTDYANAACTALGVATSGSGCVQDLSGRPTPFAPKFSGSFGATFTIPVGLNEVRVEPNIFYSSSYFMTPTDDPIVKQNPYSQADLRVGYGPGDKSWEVAVIGKNLNNAKVAQYGSTVGTSPGVAHFSLQRARSVAVSVSFRH